MRATILTALLIVGCAVAFTGTWTPPRTCQAQGGDECGYAECHGTSDCAGGCACAKQSDGDAWGVCVPMPQWIAGGDYGAPTVRSAR